MTDNDLRNQELNRHEATVEQNIEQQQAVNLGEKRRSIAASSQNSAVARIVNMVYFVFTIIELLLGVRFVLHLIAVNEDNGFASLIDTLTSPFVALFTTLLENPTLGDTSVVEITTLVAMLVWAGVGWLVGRFVWLVMSRPRHSGA